MLWIFHVVFIFLKQQHQKNKKQQKGKQKTKEKKKKRKEKSIRSWRKTLYFVLLLNVVRWWGKSLLRKSNKKCPKTMYILVYVYLFTFFSVCLFDLDTFFICLPDFLFFSVDAPKKTTKTPTTNFFSRIFLLWIFC